MADLFGSLLGFSFRGIGIPYSDLKLVLRQDLAVHKFVDADGAEVEGTGRAPLEISGKFPFINGITQGPNEVWQSPLYPDGWRLFLGAMAARTTGELIHPELGKINVKPSHCETDWVATRRGGVDVSASWIETIDQTSADANFLSNPSPVAEMAEAAANVDAAIIGPYPSMPSLPTSAATFQQLAQSLQSIAGLPDLLAASVGGNIAAIVASANGVAKAVDKTGSVLNWPVTNGIQAMISAANGLEQSILQKKRAIGLYTTQVDATLGAIAALIPGSDMGDLFVLNPSLLQSPVVPAKSTVRFYAP